MILSQLVMALDNTRTNTYFKNSSSCIHLIFTDQPSLIIDSGTHPSLHPNCHHKIIHSKIDLKITSMGF